MVSWEKSALLYFRYFCALCFVCGLIHYDIVNEKEESTKESVSAAVPSPIKSKGSTAPKKGFWNPPAHLFPKTSTPPPLSDLDALVAWTVRYTSMEDWTEEQRAALRRDRSLHYYGVEDRMDHIFPPCL